MLRINAVVNDSYSISECVIHNEGPVPGAPGWFNYKVMEKQSKEFAEFIHRREDSVFELYRRAGEAMVSKYGREGLLKERELAEKLQECGGNCSGCYHV